MFNDGDGGAEIKFDMEVWEFGEINEGDVIDTSLKKVSKSEVVKTLSSFVGVQEQVPPAYSAIKIKGMPAYKYARDGKVIELQSRKINIYEVLMKDFEFPFLTLSIKCSKGTYIRSLARDIGINVEMVDGKKKIFGDCEWESCSAKASKMTPVPGGVGPMTICSLLEQTVKGIKICPMCDTSKRPA